MARILWKVFIPLLAWLAVTVIAKSPAGGPEKVAEYIMYTIMYKYTTTEDGKPPAGITDGPKNPDFWRRDKMPLLPFREPKPPSKITNRGKKDAARGRASEMLEFPDWLDATVGLQPYDTLTDSLFRADSANSPERKLGWAPDDLSGLGSRVWNQGFGGALKMKYVRGTTDPLPDDATSYPRLIQDLLDRFSMARRWFPDEIRADARVLGSLMDEILEMREEEFGRYLYDDVESVFFTKRDKDGNALDKDGNIISPKLKGQAFKDKRVLIGTVVAAETHEVPGERPWSSVDIAATVKLKENRAPLLAAFGEMPADEQLSERRWLRRKLTDWCVTYGDSSVKPAYPEAAKSHRSVIDGWKKVRAEVALCG